MGQIMCMEFTAHILSKPSEKTTKPRGGIIEVMKGRLSVHAKFPKCMPSGKLKQ